MAAHFPKSVLMVSLAFGSWCFGQTTGNPSSTKEKPSIYIDGHDYPQFDPVSNYAWFRIHFPLAEGTEISIGGDHYRTYFADRFNVPIQFKQYFSEKSYLLGGYQLEWDLLNKGSGRPNPTPLQEVFFGVGHDIQPSWSMEARLVQPVGKQEFHKVGFPKGKTRLELGTRLKF